jgi:hypothetical protein
MPEWLWIVIAVAALVILALGACVVMSRRRQERLRTIRARVRPGASAAWRPPRRGGRVGAPGAAARTSRHSSIEEHKLHFHYLHEKDDSPIAADSSRHRTVTL